MTHALSNFRPQDVRRKAKPTDFGLELLDEEEIEVPTAGPVTVATTVAWAQSVRRFARVAIWALPGYALLLGVMTSGYYDPAAPAWQRLTRLVGGATAAWLGVVGMIALAALLVAARSRRSAVAAVLTGTAGTAVLLPVLGLLSYGHPRPFAVTVTAWAGGVLYSLGWLLMGSAVLRSGVLNRMDGYLLIVAAPLVGIGGVLFSPLRTVGSLLMLAAGIGLALTAYRLVAAGPTPVHHSVPHLHVLPSEPVPDIAVPDGAVPLSPPPAPA